MITTLKKWSAWAPGVTTQTEWHKWTRNPISLKSEGIPELSEIPAIRRRRLSYLSRMALKVTMECLKEDLTGCVNSVIASHHGEIQTMLDLTESLICKECNDVKIDQKLFPNTPAEPFWTSQRNWWSPKFFWSVNFFTGHSYGRFVPEKELFVRFVKDR